jgi:hypothetical protein
MQIGGRIAGVGQRRHDANDLRSYIRRYGPSIVAVRGRRYLRSEEAIAALRNGLDIAWVFGVIVQRLPEFSDRYTEAAVEVNKGVAWPEASSKLLATYDFSGMFQKHEEEKIGLLLQSYQSPVLQELRRGGVYLKLAESIDSTGMCLHI